MALCYYNTEIEELYYSVCQLLQWDSLFLFADDRLSL